MQNQKLDKATRIHGGHFHLLPPHIAAMVILTVAMSSVLLRAQDSPLNSSQITDLKAKAQSGDAEAQTTLGHAYLSGSGVPRNEALAAQWIRKAANHGYAPAENSLGTMYRLGNGVGRDKEEGVRWYEKAARHGSREGMFNLGTCYYNGDGVASSEFTAYNWFLLAEDAGNPAAKEAVSRSAATMSKSDTSSAYVQIADMYEKGEQLPKNEEQAVRWLSKAAEINSPGKLQLAVHLLKGPDPSRNYPEALDLCRTAAKDFAPALPCVGFIYRNGLGVPVDPVEAVKWYRKCADMDTLCMVVLADMELAGEGTKVDRASAFVLLFRAGQMRMKGATQRARELLPQLTKPESKEVERKLRDMRFDPQKVFEALRSAPPATP